MRLADDRPVVSWWRLDALLELAAAHLDLAGALKVLREVSGENATPQLLGWVVGNLHDPDEPVVRRALTQVCAAAGYRRLDLCELAADLLAAAAAGLAAQHSELDAGQHSELDAGQHAAQPFGRYATHLLTALAETVTVGRWECGLAQAAGLAALDDRAGARSVAAAALAELAEPDSRLGDTGSAAVASYREVLAALADGPSEVRAAVPPPWRSLFRPPAWNAWYWLADAVRHQDAGDHAAAADLAEWVLSSHNTGIPDLLTRHLAATRYPLAPATATYLAGLHHDLREGHRRALAEATSWTTEGSDNRSWSDERADTSEEGIDDGTRPVSLLVIDVDQLAQINDAHGRAIGDRVLVAVGGVLTHHLRPGDTAASIGGDTFIVQAEGADRDIAVQLAKRLARAVAEHAWNDIAPGLAVSVTVGMATHDPSAENPDLPESPESSERVARADFEALYRLADGDLQRSKEHRKGRSYA